MARTKKKQPDPPSCIVSRADGKFSCTLCANGRSFDKWQEHITGKKHKELVVEQAETQKFNNTVAAAYASAQEAPLQQAAVNHEPLPSFDFEAVSTDHNIWTHDGEPSVPMGIAEAAAALHAGREETVDEFRARVQYEMDKLVTDLAYRREDTVDDDSWDLPDWEDAAAPDVEEIQNEFFNIQTRESSEYAPYPDKTMMYLDILDNIDRLRLSDELLKLFLFVMKETGSRHVPTFKGFRAFQEKLRARCAPRTVEHRSELGNVFYSNDIRSSIALDFANPRVSRHLVFYPELNPKRITDACDTARWPSLPLDHLTPMIRVGAQDFYVNEVALVKSGEFVVPFLWHTWEGVLSGLCYPCRANEGSDELYIVSEREAAVRIAATDFVRNFPDLRVSGDLPCLNAWEEMFLPVMPHPLRAKADGDPLYTVFLNTWSDDVSGNVSKQWNKHWNTCVQNACLPGWLLLQNFTIKFFSTSPNASSTEQLAALKEQVEATRDDPVDAFFARDQTRCKFRLTAQGFFGDNPQQSEDCSHAGGNSNLNCRRCNNDSSAPKDDSPEPMWYTRNYAPGAPRTVEETRAAVLRQLDLACNGDAKGILKERHDTAVKDPIAAEIILTLLEKAREMTDAGERDPDAPDIPHTPEEIAEALHAWLDSQPGDHMSPLLNWSGVDPHKHTPVEILHTILLGIAKYVWHALYSQWKPEQEALFGVRLASADMTGLDIPKVNIPYIVQYKGALIGKHFKALTQTMVFQIHGMSSPELFALVKATGELSAVVWYHTIEDLPQYLDDLQILINNFLDAYAVLDPLRILDKVKLHILTHLPEDVPLFGPPVRAITEIFESFNSVFRLCSVLSNRQAPSRDIAETMSGLDRLKHLISGGLWLENGVVYEPSDRVKNVIHHPIIRRHIGWRTMDNDIPGTVQRIAKNKESVLQFTNAESTSLAQNCALQEEINLATDVIWTEGLSVVSISGDCCKVGAWVFFEDSEATMRIGRIERILTPSHTSKMTPTSLVTLRQYEIANTVHPEFGMPMVSCNEEKFVIVAPAAINFITNVQHDCRSSGCAPSGLRHIRQERQTTSRTIPQIVCVKNDRFILNTHAFHNAARLRAVIPRVLTQPLPLHTDRNVWLADIGKKAHDASNAKKKATNEKRAATRARNQQLKGKAKKPTTGRKRRRIDVEEPEAVEDEAMEIMSDAEEPPEQVLRRAPRRGAVPQYAQESSGEEGGGSDGEFIPSPVQQLRRKRK